LESEILVPKVARLKPSIPNILNSFDVSTRFKNQLKNYNDFLIGRQYLKIASSNDNFLNENFSLDPSLYGFEDSQSDSSFYVDFLKKSKVLDGRIENLESKMFQSRGGLKEKALMMSDSLNMNFSQPQQNRDTKEEVKYAKADRHETVAPKSVESMAKKELSQSEGSLDDLDELSMKMFQRLKSDIALEYTRAGR
jgi:hypothetical protein